MRATLPANELEALGVPRGPKFDKVLEDFFDAQLRGKGKDPKSGRNFEEARGNQGRTEERRKEKAAAGRDKAAEKAGISRTRKERATAPEAAADPKPGKPGSGSGTRELGSRAGVPQNRPK